MNTDNNEEALEFINRLLEQLQRAGDTNNGSKIELVYVASGGQHVETQVNIGAYPQPLPKGKGVGTPLPEALSTEAAMTLWKKAQAAGRKPRRQGGLMTTTSPCSRGRRRPSWPMRWRSAWASRRSGRCSRHCGSEPRCTRTIIKP